MSISNKIIESWSVVQEKFFDKLDNIDHLDSVTKQNIKDALVISKADVMSDILKEIIINKESKND